jgi:hypothetical protein
LTRFSRSAPEKPGVPRAIRVRSKPPAQVRPRHDDAPVEAPGPEQSRVEHVRAVGGGDEDDPLVRLEAVHLHEQLVERLLALVVPAAQASPAVAADGVDLVDEDDAGGVLLALLEEVPDAARAHAHEHLDEVGAGDGEEGHSGLAGHGPGEERLPRARRAHEQDALGDAAAQLGELLRVLEEGDDLLELVLGLVDAGHVGEGDLVVVLGHQLGLRLAEAHGLPAARLQLAHEEEEEEEEEDEGQVLHEDRHPERVLVGLLVEDLHALLLEPVEDRPGGVERADGVEVAAVPQVTVVVRVLDGHVPDVSRLDLGDEVGEGELLLLPAVLGEELVEGHEHEDEDDPQQDGLVGLAQFPKPLPGVFPVRDVGPPI